MSARIRESKREIITSWHHHPDSLEISAGIWPLVIGKSKTKPNYRVGPRTIPHYSIHLVLEGELHFQMENVERTLHAGDLFCLFPNAVHKYQTVSSDKPPRLTWLALNGHQTEQLFHKIGLAKSSSVLENAATEHVIGLFQKLTSIMSVTYSEDCSIKIISMMYELFHLLNVQTHRQTTTSPEEWVRKAVNFMALQYSQKGLRIQDVAQSLGVDRSHFTKTFTKHMEMGPKEYLHELRMKKGAEMLAESKLSITEIALSLGYSDLYSFTRAFSSHFKQSPSQYRDHRI